MKKKGIGHYFCLCTPLPSICFFYFMHWVQQCCFQFSHVAAIHNDIHSVLLHIPSWKYFVKGLKTWQRIMDAKIMSKNTISKRDLKRKWFNLHATFSVEDDNFIRFYWLRTAKHVNYRQINLRFPLHHKLCPW
jgi:hypothetical protein